LCCDKYFTKKNKKQINSDDFASSYSEHVKKQSFKEKNFPHILSKAPWCWISSSINTMFASNKLVDYFININNLPGDIIYENMSESEEEINEKNKCYKISFMQFNTIFKVLREGYSIKIDDFIGSKINKYFIGSKKYEASDIGVFFTVLTHFINYDNLQNYKLYLYTTEALFEIEKYKEGKEAKERYLKYREILKKYTDNLNNIDLGGFFSEILENENKSIGCDFLFIRTIAPTIIIEDIKKKKFNIPLSIKINNTDYKLKSFIYLAIYGNNTDSAANDFCSFNVIEGTDECWYCQFSDCKRIKIKDINDTKLSHYDFGLPMLFFFEKID
jgi:hypothetical protein